MDRDDPRFRREMRNLLDRLESQDAMDDLNRAIGWTVRCRDLEFTRDTFYGFFADPIAAMNYAAELKKDLERDLAKDEPGWECTPFPILPSS